MPDESQLEFERRLVSEWKKKGFWRGTKAREKIAVLLFSVIFFGALIIAYTADKYIAVVRVADAAIAASAEITTDNPLDFGVVAAGAWATRRLELSNNMPIPVRASILDFGGLSRALRPNKNNLVIAPGQSIDVEVAVYLPFNVDPGDVLRGSIFVLKVPAW